MLYFLNFCGKAAKFKKIQHSPFLFYRAVGANVKYTLVTLTSTNRGLTFPAQNNNNKKATHFDMSGYKSMILKILILIILSVQPNPVERVAYLILFSFQVHCL